MKHARPARTSTTPWRAHAPRSASIGRLDRSRLEPRDVRRDSSLARRRVRSSGGSLASDVIVSRSSRAPASTSSGGARAVRALGRPRLVPDRRQVAGRLAGRSSSSPLHCCGPGQRRVAFSRSFAGRLRRPSRRGRVAASLSPPAARVAGLGRDSVLGAPIACLRQRRPVGQRPPSPAPRRRLRRGTLLGRRLSQVAPSLLPRLRRPRSPPLVASAVRMRSSLRVDQSGARRSFAMGTYGRDRQAQRPDRRPCRVRFRTASRHEVPLTNGSLDRRNRSHNGLPAFVAAGGYRHSSCGPCGLERLASGTSGPCRSTARRVPSNEAVITCLIRGVSEVAGGRLPTERSGVPAGGPDRGFSIGRQFDAAPCQCRRQLGPKAVAVSRRRHWRRARYGAAMNGSSTGSPRPTHAVPPPPPWPPTSR